jgi:hypothetical protein
MDKKMTDLLVRLRKDADYREEFAAGPWAILAGIGIQRPASGSVEVSLIGTGDETDIAFGGTGDVGLCATIYSTTIAIMI